MELRTERLLLRELSPEDYNDLCPILMGSEVMYAWEHGFSSQEARQWLDATLARYEKDGYGHLAALRADTGEMVGLIGLLKETLEGTQYMGIGYILKKGSWHQGYAYEGAKACLDYAFSVLNAGMVIADIRPGNTSSRRVAEKLGMTAESEIVKVYRGIEMPHLLYVKRR
jgi:RimJ/RimL family protein N-acetyltransferase